MSQPLRSQFRMLQCMHNERENLDMSNLNEIHLSNGTYEDMDYKNVPIDRALSSASPPISTKHIAQHKWPSSSNVADPVTIKMAISTAVSAQNEIDALMNGIEELETLVSANQARTIDSSISGEKRNRSSMEISKKTNCAAFVGGFDV